MTSKRYEIPEALRITPERAEFDGHYHIDYDPTPGRVEVDRHPPPLLTAMDRLELDVAKVLRRLKLLERLLITALIAIAALASQLVWLLEQ